MTGELHHTYAAAIQHDLVDTGDALRVGVVRRPTPWFHSAVDRNHRALGPPAGLLDEFQERKEEFEEEGMGSAEAHNAVWQDVEFEDRYLDYLDASTEAKEAINAVTEELREGRDVYLVCYEDTNEKQCHRVALVDRIGRRGGRDA